VGTTGVEWHVLFAQIVRLTLVLVSVGFITWIVIKLRQIIKDSRSPLNIARSRYAKGEISLEEFDRIREELGEFRDENLQ